MMMKLKKNIYYFKFEVKLEGKLHPNEEKQARKKSNKNNKENIPFHIKPLTWDVKNFLSPDLIDSFHFRVSSQTKQKVFKTPFDYCQVSNKHDLYIFYKLIFQN